MASFQIPLVMSLATSLAKLPPLVGLYSAVVAAIMYPVFGGVPTLIVGPLPSTAVLYGNAIETLIHLPAADISKLSPLDISATLSAGMSALLLAAGLFRYGFLDNLLSRALLKGFVGAMGVIMIANQLDIQMGLVALAKEHPHHSIIDKVVFACSHWREAHRLTVVVTLSTFVIVQTIRKVKQHLLEKKNVTSVVYIPELFGMVTIATLFSYLYGWSDRGVDIVGDLTEAVSSGQSIIHNPFVPSRFGLMKRTFSTSFLCSVLGFFDSTTATKSLSAKYNFNVSSNRELVAMGATNFAVTFFGGLPSFGALGRSKVHILAGALTPMASVIMAFTILLAIKYFLGLLVFLPECVLSLSTTIIGLTVLEEVPNELLFFYRIGGYDEIFTICSVFFCAIFLSVETGIIVGVVMAVVKVVRVASKSRIHVLGRIPNTSVFRNADELIEESFESHLPAPEEELEELVAEIQLIEGVLIIKIPEPLTFANIGDLWRKLFRIEAFGTLAIHPSQPVLVEKGYVKSIVFDCKGMTAIDSAATQTLYEIVSRYVNDKKVCVFFSRVPVDKEVRLRLVKLGIAALVNKTYETSCPVKPLGSLPFLGSSTSLNRLTSGAMNSYRLGNGFFLSIDDALKAIDVETV